MKVLLTSDDYLPLIGGGQIHVKELMTRLRAAGHEARLVTLQPGVTDDETGITRIDWNAGLPNAYRRVAAAIQEFRPDVVAAHYSFRLAALSTVAARLRGIPVTVTLHGLGTVPMDGGTFRAQLLFHLYQRVSIGLAARVIATSQDMLDAVPYAAPKTVIITNGADAAKFDPEVWNARPETKALREKYAGRTILLTVRRLNPKCGLQYLLEAMPEIAKRRPDVLWLMVGTGRLEEKLRARVKELGLERHVVMAGAIDNERTPAYFAAADLVVFPSTAESTSISCIEAMMMGKAVAASAVGGLIELLGRDGARGKLFRLVDHEASSYEAPPVEAIPKERYDEMIGTIAWLLDAPDERARIGAAGRAYARERFDWGEIARRTTEIYKEALKKKA